MARPIYPHELTDPDFQWLISTYKDGNPDSVVIEGTCLPVVLVRCESIPVAPEPIAVAPSDPNADPSEEFIEDIYNKIITKSI